jgi:UDP-N-acetylmuramoyl-tripeptide--D-alanyl-D-alanine ligase
MPVIDISTLYNIYQKHPDVQTDTRRLTKNCIFFALKGPSFNGNHFAEKALLAGASFVVVDEPIHLDDPRILYSNDCLDTLQQLALFHRQRLHIPVIAITGSNGKTTTKELVHAVLSTYYRTATTEGNLNNHIGIPLTLLRIRSDHEIAIVEMGANHQQEIAKYCTYTLPTHGIITNCGKAHLEGFGGEEGVKKGKGELYTFIGQQEGTIFAFDDYDYLHQMSQTIKNIVWYGTKKGIVTGHAKPDSLQLSVEITSGVSFTELPTQLVGNYNLPNVLCAIAIGKHFNVPDDKIKDALAGYVPGNSRSQLIQKGSNQIILDAYNANPTSMKAAIENFAKSKNEKKVLLLGAMMELGDASVAEHQSLINFIEPKTFSLVIIVGGDFKNTKHNFLYFSSTEDAIEYLKTIHFNSTTILIKGSRSMRMEVLLETIQE